jgi:hypothetical protein
LLIRRETEQCTIEERREEKKKREERKKVEQVERE